MSWNHPYKADQIENEFRNIKLKLKGPNRHSELQAVKALMAMSAQNFQNQQAALEFQMNNQPPDDHNNTITNNGIFIEHQKPADNSRVEPETVASKAAIGSQSEIIKPASNQVCPTTPAVVVKSQQQETNGSLRSESLHVDNQKKGGPTPPDCDSSQSQSKGKSQSRSKKKNNTNGDSATKTTKKTNKIKSRDPIRDERALDLSSSRSSESPEPIYGISFSMTEDEFRVIAEREGIKDVIGEPICKLCNNLFSGPLGIALHMCPAMKRQTYRCELCGEDKWKTKANLHSHLKWCKFRFAIKSAGDTQVSANSEGSQLSDQDHRSPTDSSKNPE